MGEVILLVGIVIGAILFGGGLTAGIWMSRIITTTTAPSVKEKDDQPPEPLPTPVYEVVPLQDNFPPPPLRAPPAKTKVDPPTYRYGAHSELESSDNFYKLQERLRMQQQGGPLAESYNSGGLL